MDARLCSECGRGLRANDRHRKCERCRKLRPCACGQPMYYRSTQCLACQSANSFGENNHNWKGGRTYNWYEFYIKPYRHSNREKVAAHRAVYAAIKSGELKKPKSCAWCGNSFCRIEAHHEDYSKPLEVLWLCPSCHHTADDQRRRRIVAQVVEHAGEWVS